MPEFQDPHLISEMFTPVGTILKSLLPPEVFEAKVKPRGAWVFADGRRIPETPLGDFMIANRSRYSPDLFDNDIPKVPDLRGVMIRGIDHDGAENKARNDDKGETQSGRKIASYQRDTFQDHRHEYLSGARTHMSQTGGNEIFADVARETKPKTERTDPADAASSETRPRNVSAFHYIRVA